MWFSVQISVLNEMSELLKKHEAEYKVWSEEKGALQGIVHNLGARNT